NGGARLYVVRAFGGDPAAGAANAKTAPVLPANGAATTWFVARFPGTYFSNGKVVVQNVATPVGKQGMANVAHGSVVRVHSTPPPPPPAGGPPPAPPAPGPAPAPTSVTTTVEVWVKVSGAWQKRSAGALAPVSNTDLNAVNEAYLVT